MIHTYVPRVSPKVRKHHSTSLKIHIFDYYGLTAGWVINKPVNTKCCSILAQHNLVLKLPHTFKLCHSYSLSKTLLLEVSNVFQARQYEVNNVNLCN